MKFIHRITVNSTPVVRAELAAMSSIIGSWEPTTGNVVTFEVDEAFRSWPGVKRRIAQRDALDIVTTEFSEQEIATARWLTLHPSWHWVSAAGRRKLRVLGRDLRPLEILFAVRERPNKTLHFRCEPSQNGVGTAFCS